MMEDGWAIAAPGIGDCTPLEFVAVVKCITPDGDIVLVHTITPDLSQWEAIGMIDALDANVRWAHSGDFEDSE